MPLSSRKRNIPTIRIPGEDDDDDNNKNGNDKKQQPESKTSVATASAGQTKSQQQPLKRMKSFEEVIPLPNPISKLSFPLY